MFSRPRDSERSSSFIPDLGEKHYGVRTFKDEDGYTLRDWAFGMGCWYLERWWGFGNIVGEEGETISNNPGIHKWYIDPEKCFQFWVRKRGDCAVCISGCVFNKPNTWFHNGVRWHVKYLPRFDRFYLWMDDLCGYGRQMKMRDVWN